MDDGKDVGRFGHELAQPLTALAMGVETLAYHARQVDSTELERDIKNLKRVVARLAAIVNEMQPSEEGLAAARR